MQAENLISHRSLDQLETDLVNRAARMTCDFSLLSVLKDKNGEPLNVGRKRRIVPPHIERVLCARDKTCRFPGCLMKV